GPPGAGGPGRRGPGMNLQGAEGRRNGLASAAGIEFNYVHADLEFEGQNFKDVAVRYKGNGTFMQSRGTFKRSLKVDFNKFVKGQKLAGISKLNFHNNVTDASWMNEVLSHRLFRDAGLPASRTAYARVYVTVPGRFDKKYFGLYSLVEDIDNNFAQENFGTKKGAIFKPVTPNPFASLGDDWKNYNQTYDPKTELSQEQRENLSIHRPWRGENRFLDRVVKVESFKKLYLARLGEFNKTIFTPERFHQQVDEIAAAIRPAVQEESEEKLARFDKVVAG